jgi:hypothetical protein
VVRKRLAALDRMVAHRLEAFAQRHADLDPGLAGDTSALAQEFHASLKDAYDAFRETGDRKELWQAVRGAFSTARSGLRFVTAGLRDGSEGPRVIVDPGPIQAPQGEPVAHGEPAGGPGVVPGPVAGGAPGVTVSVTPLPPVAAGGESGGAQTSSLDGILAGLVQHFSELLSGLEDLIGQGLDDDASFELAIDLHAEIELGGSSLGELLDTLG